ncbi:hypothetical protein PsorP6_015830 [Peronosclerospora sorghi]|uniref:Uncharacterized protein n=1 Tax=Peronosclerospora sorghi TaxID=230839 RepID=A0ACC0WNE7_9STRA|nr:hypothetical protein PsorP6_015830 [Peronosclerospora sorghi]
MHDARLHVAENIENRWHSAALETVVKFIEQSNKEENLNKRFALLEWSKQVDYEDVEYALGAAMQSDVPKATVTPLNAEFEASEANCKPKRDVS